MHKKSYPLLRGVRGGTKAAAPPLSSECEQVDELLKSETSHASAQGVRGSKNPLSRWPEDMLQRNLHSSTYNIYTKRTVWSPPFCENFSVKRALELLFPSPAPPRKKHPQPTRKRLLIESPSPVSCPRNRFPGPSPSVNPCTGPHAKDSHPKPASDCALTPSRARISSPLAITREQRRALFQHPPQKERNRDVCPRNGPGLSLTGPSPGANPPTYPSSLPRASGKLPGH